jgi:glycosyltransferase 2 family protein
MTEAQAPEVHAPHEGRSHRRDWLAGLVSIVSLAAVVWWALRQEPPKFPTSLSDIALVAAAVLAYIPITLIRGWRWHRILRHAHIQHDPTDAYALIPVGYMGNTVLPARGGEVLRIVLLGRRSESRRREILGSIMAERLLDAVVLVLLFAAMTWGGVAGSPVDATILLVVVIAAAVAALALVAGLVIYRRAQVGERIERAVDLVRPVVKASRLLIGPLGILLLAVTFVVWIGEGGMYLLVAKSLHLHIDLVEATFLVVLASFFSMVPAAPGYVGTFDAAVAFGLDALGIVGGDAVAFVLLIRFVFFVPITVVGIVLALTRYGGIKGIRSLLDFKVASAGA